MRSTPHPNADTALRQQCEAAQIDPANMPNQDSIIPTNDIPSLNVGKTPQSQGGAILLNEFEVERELGRGGMGKVYLVRSRTTGRKFAMKEALIKDNTQQKAFLAELQTWIDLPEHPNILACRFFRTVGNETLIFADYCEGGSLADWIAEGKLQTLEQKLDVAIQFAWGLHAIHERGLVHQDIKPGNVLMTKNGVPKVADFGLARAKQRMAATSAAKGAQSVGDAPVLVTSGGMTAQGNESVARELLDELSSSVAALDDSVRWRHKIGDTIHEFASNVVARGSELNSPEERHYQIQCIAFEAQTLRNAGDLKTAIRLYKKALELRPENGVFWNNLSVAYSKCGNHVEALRCCDEGLKLLSDNSDLWYNRGLSCYALSDYREAVMSFEKAFDHGIPDAKAQAAYCRDIMEGRI